MCYKTNGTVWSKLRDAIFGFCVCVCFFFFPSSLGLGLVGIECLPLGVIGMGLAAHGMSFCYRTPTWMNVCHK